jgi:hypothetical protein
MDLKKIQSLGQKLKAQLSVIDSKLEKAEEEEQRVKSKQVKKN